jgi:hypothetical protein
MNSFYTPVGDLMPGTKARSVDINNLNKAVDTAFDKLPDVNLLKRGTVGYAVDTGTVADAYKVDLGAGITAYTDGLLVRMKPTRENTAAATLNVNGLGAVAIKRQDGADVQAGDILTNGTLLLSYVAGANCFILASSTNSQAKQATASATAAAASAGAAAGSATAASGSADYAAGRATAAGDAAGVALSARDAAQGYRSEAQGFRDSALSYRDSALGYRDNASTSASAADASATLAANWATSLVNTFTGAGGKYGALKYANDAATSATLASNWATSLVNTFTGAGGLYGARKYANDAATSATSAKDWATKTAAEVVVGQGYGAQKYANDAAGSATAAGTAKTAAETAKTAAEAAQALAQKWATQTSAEVVAGQGYGAKYYADMAATLTVGKAPTDSPAFTGNPTAPTPALGDNDLSIATTEHVQNALKALGFNTAGMVTIPDLDAVTQTNGFYRVDTSSAGTRPEDYGVVIVASQAGGAGVSNWSNQLMLGASGRKWVRSNINRGGWSKWRDAMPDMAGNMNVDSMNGGPLAGFRNRYINGHMLADARNLAVAIQCRSGDGTDYRWGPERWYVYGRRANGNIMQYQRTGTGTGAHPYWLTATNLAGGALGADDNVLCGQNIEALNLHGLGWGAGGAKPITVSFWVNASIAGTYAYAIRSNNLFMSYVATFVVAQANVDQYITITIPGPTSGVWMENGGVGAYTNIDYGIGPNFTTNTVNQWVTYGTATAAFGYTGGAKITGTTNATFKITEIQFEAGDRATPYEFRHPSIETMLCQRYFYRLGGSPNVDIGAGACWHATASSISVRFPVTMRAAPSVSYVNVPGFTTMAANGAHLQVTSFDPAYMVSQYGCELTPIVSGGGQVAGNATVLRCESGASWINFDAEI